MRKNKAIFLDRDGVINKELGRYTTNISEFEILPDLISALKTLQNAGYIFIVITNQGGIAKGLYNDQDVIKMHNYFINECQKESVKITAVYYSPHHESKGKSLSRKPASLMLERAISKYNIDPKTSFMIGDSDRDIEAAIKVNIRGVKIMSNSSLMNIVESLL